LALKSGSWNPTNPFYSRDSHWAALVRALLQRGRIQEAQAVGESIVSYDTINEMLLDKAFDPVTQAAPARFDLRKAMEHDVADLREKVKADPDELQGVNALAETLNNADQPQAALAVLDAAIARATPKDGSSSPFSDMDQLNWTYNQRALTLVHLNRIDEAIALMKLGAVRPENGSVNVSQPLNLAQLYEEQGRPADAMAVIADGDSWDLSAYGRMDFQGVRACAATQLNDQVHVQQSLAYIRAHLDDAPGWAIDASICVGDLDSAAKIVIHELADPNQRSSALADLQEGPLDPSLSSTVRGRKTLLWALYKRPDVEAAANAVGHHAPSPFHVWGMGR
jgi:tetratricopeptide (TPR) repeat protein